jgi:hypothetical protein
MRALWILCAAVCAAPAFAAAPTLVGNGATQGISASGNFTANIGSPASGDLSVLIVACDDAGANAITMTGPSGYTQESHQTSGDTFGDEAVYWKQATGSEGATVTIGGLHVSTTECGAWYWKFTGYNTTDPLDATHIAWAISATQNPPSQTFASGPRDGYVVAFGQTRGDNTAGTEDGDLGTNSHSDAGGTANGRTIEVSWGAFTATSSKDPGAFTFSGTSRIGNAVTAVIYGAASASYLIPTKWRGRVGSPGVIR